MAKPVKVKEARPIVKKGEVWDTTGRKGDLRLRFLEDVDFNGDDFFQAEIVEGTAQFASDAYRLAQRMDGVGTPGTGLPFRTTLVTLLKQVALPFGEQKEPALNVTGRIF